MEARTKITKDVLCEEARFVLANIMAEARYGNKTGYDEIRHVCAQSITIPFTDYISFLESEGYLTRDVERDMLEVSNSGASVVNGAGLAAFTDRAVAYFRKSKRSRDETAPKPADLRTEEPTAAFRESPARTGGGELRYEKLEALGAGGVGTVYRANQLALSREVAMKELREVFEVFGETKRELIVQRFAEAVTAWAAVSHPHILPVHDVDIDSRYPFVVTELAAQGTLRDRLSRGPAIPLATTYNYLVDTLCALDAAHAEGLYHGALKPENLLLDKYGSLKVSDFGFSRIVDGDASGSATHVYIGKGNIAYMAPELYNRGPAQGPASDIYALGIIFYELLTARLPGRRSPMPSEVDSHIAPSVDEIFDKMTRDNVEERYSSVAAVLSDLKAIGEFSALVERGMGDRGESASGDSANNASEFDNTSSTVVGEPTPRHD